MAEKTVDKTGISRFIDALAVFIKQEQAKARSEENARDKQRKENNSSWAKKYPIQLHGSIIMWKVKGENKS